jgi:citrate lyase beta subunit
VTDPIRRAEADHAGRAAASPAAGVSAPHLADSLGDALDARLAAADDALSAGYPGNSSDRQPVHTVYVAAPLFQADLAQRWGEAAWAVVDKSSEVFTEVAGDQDLVARVRAKLVTEPIEDVRIDFEDGYGAPGDDVEDRDVDAAASGLALAIETGVAPPSRGIRFKSLEAPTRRRGVRTLTLFLARFLECGATLDDFVVTLPKITSVDQVEAMTDLVGRLEESFGLVSRSLRFELQIETPQSILGPDGSALVARMIHAGDHRVTALHYGTYDYSAFCGIPAAYQSMEHPVADHAKAVMQAAAAGTGVRLSDGSTNVLPVGSPDEVRHGWELHARLVRRSLERGYYQGWDLHPAQLPTRFAATYAFFLEGFSAAASRLRDYMGDAGSSVMDEPATARALADFLVRAVDCGAVSLDEAADATGQDGATLVALARPRRA